MLSLCTYACATDGECVERFTAEGVLADSSTVVCDGISGRCTPTVGFGAPCL